MNQELKDGLKDSVIFGVSFIFLYLAIGANGLNNDLSFFQTLSTTLFVFSTPLQFLLTQSYQEGYILIPLILAMNARFLLISGTLAPYFAKVKLKSLVCSSILICPSVFSGCLAHFKSKNLHPFMYFLALGLPIWGISLVCTGLGYYLGGAFYSAELKVIISMVLPLQFTALAAKHYPNYKEMASYILGFVFAPVFLYLSPKFYLLMMPFVIGAVMLLLESRGQRK